MTHTYAILGVSPATYVEIRELLVKAGYGDQLIHAETEDELFNMHGIAIKPLLLERCEQCNASLARCAECSTRWCLDHSPTPLKCPKCGQRPRKYVAGE